MKNRNLDHKDDWATPPFIYDELTNVYDFEFDPSPFLHDVNKWDGLLIEWKERNFLNPPYNRKVKEAFVKKAIEEKKKGKLIVMLLPVSTSTKLFHEHILPNAEDIKFIKKRIPFIGINSKGEYVNWHLWSRQPPKGSVQVKNSGMHDSMVVVLDGRSK